MPFISICIPAYKNKAFVERLLKSIADQTFKDFEVIVTDDSPTNELEYVCNKYGELFPVNYYKNVQPLGTPANWNLAISKAKGDWIKLMHHDDWFAQENSLDLFAKAALHNFSIDFIFSGFNEIQATSKKTYTISTIEKILLRRSPLNLFKKNFIGSPSTTLIKNNRQVWYDENLKWVVDFEFYIRCLQKSGFFVLNEPLVNIGIHNTQVTKEAFRNPKIEIPENLYLINKLGENALKNLFVYDYYWRLFRNLGMRNLNQITYYSNNNRLSPTIKKMFTLQSKIPLLTLKIGIFSKITMFVSKILT